MAATLLIYFGVCGFVFGFLWSRLYLRRWFVDADAEVKKLSQEVERLRQQNTDGNALAMVLRELNRGPYDIPATEKELEDAIKQASSLVRNQIFEITTKSSATLAAVTPRPPDVDVRYAGIESILRALIATDSSGRAHAYHAELSYALRRQQVPDLQGALDAISRAIAIRDTTHASGWRFYEFHRARCRILSDPNFIARKPSTKDVVDSVLDDLRPASADGAGWVKWRKDMPAIDEWLQLNKIDPNAM